MATIFGLGHDQAGGETVLHECVHDSHGKLFALYFDRVHVFASDLTVE